MKPFVTAVWSDLFIISFPVADYILLPFLPTGLTLDKFQGSAYVSVVAFHFGQVHVLGIPSPIRQLANFPQWNLRFYVRLGDERGIVFIKEYVPTTIVANCVRWLYNEPYVAAPLAFVPHETATSRRVCYILSVDNHVQTIWTNTTSPPKLPEPNTMGEFVTKQGWGCGQSRRGKSMRFKVTHAPWRNYSIANSSINVDFELLYGAKWAFLDTMKPDSIILCEGSPVSVSHVMRR
jgi:uncharacterized protein YqjF (DUF2071 family)